ncbi:hypothetical protein DH2020_024759 [Rehmannia glutinosa]|uniref:Uncharacterized protein n=1 Tax=Rehmannia glutinosa TaxID=99300 RepID=A0ABR0W2D0_REHGL
MYHTLALCYHGEGCDFEALNLWRNLLKPHEDSTFLPALLFVSKICAGSSEFVEEGISFSHRAIENLQGRCDQLIGVAQCMLGISLSASCGSAMIDNERVERQLEALKSLEIAGRMTNMKDPVIVYHLCLENAEQRKLDAALHLAKSLLKLEAGSNIRGWILLARILSAQKCFLDAEAIVNVALDQTGMWDHGELLRTKAKLQIAQCLVKEAIETYSQLLAVLQVQRLLQEARGNLQEALEAYTLAVEVDPTHVPSLVSQATVLRRMNCQSLAIVRTFLTGALRLDRMNTSAWHNLGLVYKDGGSSLEAAECFQAAAFLEETEPIEPFR